MDDDLAARGPYRCCPHCADDLIHDVEKDDHTVPCQLCQNDEIRRAKAEAWDEGHLAGHEDARAVQPTYPQPTLNPYADEIAGDDS